MLKKIPTFDFAIILATPDEFIKRQRNGVTEECVGMRDNVIFEIGLCVMALGCNRTLILQHKDAYLFDDLIGVSGIHSVLRVCLVPVIEKEENRVGNPTRFLFWER